MTKVGLAKHQFIFSETSGFLPADDPKALDNVHNCTVASRLAFSY